MAKYMGINSRKVDNITFAIGLGLTGIAGCLVALGSIDSTVGQSYIVNSSFLWQSFSVVSASFSALLSAL